MVVVVLSFKFGISILRHFEKMPAPDRPTAGAFAALRLFERVCGIDRVGGLAAAALPPPGRGLTFFQNRLCCVEGF